MNQEVLIQAMRNLSTVVEGGMSNVGLTLPQVGMELTGRIKRTLSTPGRGRMYRGRRGRGDHRASAPGDPPAVDVGQYRASWDWAPKNGSQSLREVAVATNQERGPALEFGRRDKSIKARPHVRPAVQEYSKDLGKRIASAMVTGERATIAKLPRQEL